MTEFEYNEAEVKDYHDYQDNREQAKRLLANLKARESKGMGTTKIFWKDGQPTLVECSSRLYWESQLKKRGFVGRPEYPALPATQSYPRKPATWEAKLEAKNRRTYTLEETQTMNFKTSGHLPAHYYMDESVLEAYVESLTKEK